MASTKSDKPKTSGKSKKSDKTDKAATIDTTDGGATSRPSVPSAAAQMAGTVSDEVLVSGRDFGANAADAAAGVGPLPAAREAGGPSIAGAGGAASTGGADRSA